MAVDGAGASFLGWRPNSVFLAQSASELHSQVVFSVVLCWVKLLSLHFRLAVAIDSVSKRERSEYYIGISIEMEA